MTATDAQLRMQLAAIHATATSLVQQVAVVLAGLPESSAPPSAQAARPRRPVASDLPADLND